MPEGLVTPAHCVVVAFLTPHVTHPGALLRHPKTQLCFASCLTCQGTVFAYRSKKWQNTNLTARFTLRLPSVFCSSSFLVSGPMHHILNPLHRSQVRTPIPSAATLLLLHSNSNAHGPFCDSFVVLQEQQRFCTARKALLGCSSCFDCLICDADQSNLAATPDSGKGSFSSEEGIAICQQEVSDEDISAYAKLHQAQVFATSAKTGIGVRRMFSSIAQDLAAGTMQESQVQHTHRHAARPVTPTFMSSRPGTNPSSPLENSHNSTYSRTRKKYFQNCCF